MMSVVVSLVYRQQNNMGCLIRCCLRLFYLRSVNITVRTSGFIRKIAIIATRSVRTRVQSISILISSHLLATVAAEKLLDVVMSPHSLARRLL